MDFEERLMDLEGAIWRFEEVIRGVQDFQKSIEKRGSHDCRSYFNELFSKAEEELSYSKRKFKEYEAIASTRDIFRDPQEFLSFIVNICEDILQIVKYKKPYESSLAQAKPPLIIDDVLQNPKYELEAVEDKNFDEELDIDNAEDELFRNLLRSNGINIEKYNVEGDF